MYSTHLATGAPVDHLLQDFILFRRGQAGFEFENDANHADVSFLNVVSLVSSCKVTEVRGTDYARAMNQSGKTESNRERMSQKGTKVDEGGLF
jgi:hypothetical protein